MENLQSGKIPFKDSSFLDAEKGVASFRLLTRGNVVDRLTVSPHLLKKGSMQFTHGLPLPGSLLPVNKKGEAARYSLQGFHSQEVDMTGIRPKVTARIPIEKSIDRVDVQIDNRSVHREASK